MRHSISSSVLVQLTAAQILLLSAAASPAAAKLHHHHHHTGARHHGAQAGISRIGAAAATDPGTKNGTTNEDPKGKANTIEEAPQLHQPDKGEATPPLDQASSKGEKHTNGVSRGDDHGDQHAGPHDNSIDMNTTIVPHIRFGHRGNERGWTVFKTSHQVRKPSAPRKATMQGSKTLAGGKTFAKRGNKNNLTRNAIGQLIKRAGADRNEHVVKQPDPLALNGIRRPPVDPAGPGVMAITAPAAHPKLPVPVAWSVGRPHDPPPGATPLQAGLDGHGMIRIGGRTAAIGGGANLNTGVLNASTFHPKVR
jgi:hypothetical protein